MSIAKRLYLMIGIALSGLLLVSTVNFLKMGKTFEVTNQGNVRTVPSLLLLARAIDDFGQLRAHTAQHVLNVDDMGKRDIERLIQADSGRIEKALKEYEPMVSNPADRKLLVKLKGHLDAYSKGVKETLELSRVNLFDEARAHIIQNSANEALLRDAFGIQMKIGETEAKKVAEEGQAEIASATWTSLAITAVVALLTGAMGILITRALLKQLKLAAVVADTVAAGDLTSRIEVTSKDETGKMILALKEMNEGLIRIVGGVRGGTESIAIASTEIASGNADLSSRTEEQASALQQTASAIEGLTSTAKENADNARKANQLAVSASEVASKGGAVVSEVVLMMEAINASSKKIIDIIGVIDGIAFQTNILALNAAVEAARAGEQGRGFAVVASEVRTLAQRSASAAKEIKSLIGDSVQKVGDGTKLVDQAGATMEEILESFSHVTKIMAKITVASQEQTAGIEQINRAVTEMESTTQRNATLVEQAAAASEVMREKASQLAQLVSVFKLRESEQSESHSNRVAGVAPGISVIPPGELLQPRVAARRRSAPAKERASDEWAQF